MGDRWLRDDAQLRQLVENEPGASVVTVCLDLDPSQFAVPRARAAEVESLLDEARHRYTDSEEHRPLGMDSAVARDLERVRSYLEFDFEPRGARGVAVFCASEADLFEVVRVTRPVPRTAVVAERPYVRPLVEAEPFTTDWFVLLVSRADARILVNEGAGLRELERIEDQVHGWHDEGGWSQARYQRHISKQVKDHVRGVCATMHRIARRRAVGGLLVGAPVELRPLVESELHPDLRRLLAGYLQVDVENSKPADVEAEARELTRRKREEADERLLAVLRAGRGEANEPVVTGLDHALEALNERRVGTLVFAPGLGEAGVACRQCGWLGRSGKGCPVDGAELAAVEDVVERAVEAALTQAAAVRVLAGVRQLGAVAAILRRRR